MANRNVSIQATKGNIPMAESLQHCKDQGVKALEMLAFLAEVMDGGGDDLTLTPDARHGLSHILSSLYSTVGEVIEAVDIRHLEQ